METKRTKSKERQREKERDKITHIRNERIVTKAYSVDITKTIIRFYYELYANEF